MIYVITYAGRAMRERWKQSQEMTATRNFIGFMLECNHAYQEGAIMKKLKKILACGMILVITMACSLPLNLLAEETPTPIPSPRAGEPAFTVTPAPYVGVRLFLDDLPVGFSEISQEQLASYGLDMSMFNDLFEQAGLSVQTQAVSAFIWQSGGSTTLVASLSVAPIPGLHQALWDFFISNPDLILQARSSGIFEGSQASALPGMDQIGDHSAGFRLSSSNAISQTDLGVVREDEVVTFVLVLSQTSSNLNVNIIQLMQQLDDRVLQIIEGT
jgi:hypothetical protein